MVPEVAKRSMMLETVHHVTWCPDWSQSVQLIPTLCNQITPTLSILTIDCPQLSKRMERSKMYDHAHHYFFSLSPSLHLCLLTHSSIPHTAAASQHSSSIVCPIWTSFKMTHATICLIHTHHVHMLYIIALAGLETCGSRFLSFVLIPRSSLFI